MSEMNLTGHFLIAMPQLKDPNFLKSVTYIWEHDENGAFGIVINHDLNASVGELFLQLGLDCNEDNPYTHMPLHLGGPVEMERGFVLHQPFGEWKSTLVQNEDLALTSSLDMMQAISKGEGPENIFVALGYAGWGAGQLEQEIQANAWLNGPADIGIIFNLPSEQRWKAAADLMGVDLALLSNDIGHA